MKSTKQTQYNYNIHQWEVFIVWAGIVRRTDTDRITAKR